MASRYADILGLPSMRHFAISNFSSKAGAPGLTSLGVEATCSLMLFRNGAPRRFCTGARQSEVPTWMGVMSLSKPSR
jgi:hypothetical protein